MSRFIELRRHTANDGDVLTPDGIEAAVAMGGELGPYDLVVSSGAQRATQTAACFLAGMGKVAPLGVIVDEGFRSQREDRWREFYSATKRGELEGFLEEDAEYVREEASRFAEAVRRVAALLPDGGKALVVGHSPMLEATVWAVTRQSIPPLGKGEGVVLSYADDAFTLAG